MTIEQQINAIESFTVNETCNEVLLQEKARILKKGLKYANKELSVIKLFYKVAAQRSNPGYVGVFGGNAFYISRVTKKWIEAQIFCRNIDASLIHSMDYQMNAFMKNMLLSNSWESTNVWISAYGQGSRWLWET